MDVVSIVVAAIGALATAVATVVSVKGRIQTENVVALVKSNKSLNSQVARLDEWKIAGRYYIARLRGQLADNGIEALPLPAELREDLSGE
ncbi:MULTISPECIES: hypothetical protein [unclassified Rhodococcus (in: high G+C Gram-positive bacteria)]|uniref:hypothetical protein n=1 Tax=unclassified Rhodococcus (in: high G+C Gram-positive bacteria) TaxID=192944 RepID=UPI000B9C0712|nr:MULTISPECIES: hypothetical protein [unclassified Rhodococcus (in: high G+C Gram-positive bacteria)]OZE37082.1 hypothetical protein CH259_09030 [Rhodococcus sp. 05-2254-4]OZE44859.1 hypothetical protein CH261_14865 [Rhodococcus sp. 05-2254-3]OZE45208.1 hypothetical protein CH283_22660 [Rhodococcus sp. 05-2254-2]